MAEQWTLHVGPGAPNDPVFVGVGELPTGKFPDRGFIEALTKVALLALKDAGMAPKDVDTILLIPNLHGAADQADLVFSRMVEELGIHGSCKSSYMVHSGGSTSDNAVRSAHGLITAGHAQTVLVLQAERWGSADLNEMITMLSKNGIPGEWELPTGTQFNAIGAMITRRYMHASGSTPEEMASICVTLRNWANLNEKRDVLPQAADGRADPRLAHGGRSAAQLRMPADGRRRLRIRHDHQRKRQEARHHQCGARGGFGRLRQPLLPQPGTRPGRAGLAVGSGTGVEPVRLGGRRMPTSPRSMTATPPSPPSRSRVSASAKRVKARAGSPPAMAIPAASCR
ncbi:hypothetical protein ACFSTD_19210 [Novosphingobium colocasiae]